jgi:ATP-dependent Lon protease
MSEKKGKNKGPIFSEVSTDFVKTKVKQIHSIVRKTMLSMKKNRKNDLFSNNDASLSVQMLSELNTKLNDIASKIGDVSSNALMCSLQTVVDNLSMIISGFGTMVLGDLLFISFGTEYIETQLPKTPLMQQKFSLLNEYITPVGYKIINWKRGKTAEKKTDILCSDKIVEHIIYVEDSNTLECFDIDKPSTSSLYQKLYGVQIVFQNETLKKTLIVSGIMENIEPEWIDNDYIHSRRQQLKLIENGLTNEEKPIFMRIMKSLSLKDYLTLGNQDIKRKVFTIYADITKIKKNRLDITVKAFLELDCFVQRNMIINLLNYDNDTETQYITNILYSFIDINKIDNIDSKTLQILNDSMPLSIKERLNTISKEINKQMTESLQKYDDQTITLEQQILLLKVGEKVKDRAMHKLRELKGRSEESNTKTRQYLEGLVRIPFGIFKEEAILKNTKETNARFCKLLAAIEKQMNIYDRYPKKNKYTNAEINKGLAVIKDTANQVAMSSLLEYLHKATSTIVSETIGFINNHSENKNEKISQDRIIVKPRAKKEDKREALQRFLNNLSPSNVLVRDVYDKLFTNPISLRQAFAEINNIQSALHSTENDMKNILCQLDKSIHGHKHAKNQILKIISQWMNGQQSGYCFGFEGSPGIGKTSLAKNGISNCLIDDDGTKRPFVFIPLGGASNGSTLEGHGYTYMNSTWGKIADVLMETKCMNPIIYIDELDKVSKTENGKEIIGILINMIDSTQSSIFQDKYFSGIEIDLSKVLFIFSYNDPEQIDKILLDRIHRIRFDNLNSHDKLTICNDFILPEINDKMGFQNTVEIEDETILHIIENYTREPGVRKLKELLFDIYGEINIELLKTVCTPDVELPMILSKSILEEKYLKKYQKIIPQKINETAEVGLVNALWANALGMGGIIPVQTAFFPSDQFLELKLTGLQGDVMKESMNVAKTLAWNLTPNSQKKMWLEHFKETKCQGLHIHCPDGAISKDGPSAGAAITVAIYSLLNRRVIKNTLGLTGEITLSGKVTQIGGLDSKILGGIKGGIKTFLYPSANQKDMDDFLAAHGNTESLDIISFISVDTIEEIFQHIFDVDE